MAIKHYDASKFSSSESLGYLAKLVHTLMHERAAAAFANHDINFTQWIILTKLREGSAVTAGDLCRAMRHDTGALTRVLDQLEELDYVERVRSQTDRRVVELHLTPAGRKRSQEFVPLVVDLLNEALADFSKTEFQELKRLLKKLIHGLQSRQGPAS
jgi:DNA-binding MarR family transcriptional regulator